MNSAPLFKRLPQLILIYAAMNSAFIAASTDAVGALTSAYGSVVSGGVATNMAGEDSGLKFNQLLRGGFIAEKGMIVFPGTLQALSADAPGLQGIWKHDGTTLKQLARSGETAPEASGAVFNLLPNVSAINDHGQVTLLATLRSAGSSQVTTDNDTGLWSEVSGAGLHLLIREGDPILSPSLPAGTQIGQFGSGCFATAKTGADSGQVAFTVTLKGGTTDTALLRASLTGPTVTTIGVVARENTAAPGSAESFGFLNSSYTDSVRMDAQGNIAFGAVLKPSGKTSLWYQPVAGGSPVKAMVAGDVAPGTTATFQSLDLPVMGGRGTFAFRGVLTADGDNATNTKNDGIWRGTAAAGFTNILRRGDSNINRPGLFSGAILAANPGIKVGNIYSGWLTNANNGAWLGFVDKAGSGISDPSGTLGIYTDTSGTMALLIASGDPAPGIAGATLANMDHPVVGGVEQVAFIGTVTGAGTTPSNNKGLWRTATQGGSLSLVMRIGDAMKVAPGGAKIIADLDLPGSGDASHLWELPVMDEKGGMLVFVTFTDGSSSQVIIPRTD